MHDVAGGTEKHVLDISKTLSSRGHAVTLACPSDGRFAQRVDELGLRRVHLESNRAYDWNQLLGLFRVIDRDKYDVVHTHLPFDYASPGFAARIKGIPAVVMTRHMPSPFSSRFSAYLCSSVVYDRIVAVSGFLRTLLIESGARPDRVDVVYNGISPVNPDPEAGRLLREELQIPGDAILIGAAGRMSSGKGFDILLKAVRQVNLDGVDAYCAIFGGGALLADLRALAEDLQIDSRVRLPGFRDAGQFHSGSS